MISILMLIKGRDVEQSYMEILFFNNMIVMWYFPLHSTSISSYH